MSATRAFALRTTLRAACHRPIQPQLRLSLCRRGYASGHAAAQGAHKASLGSDMPWLATSLAVSLPMLGYLVYSRPVAKSHDEHLAEASKEHGVQQAKPDEEIGEGHEPIPTSHTDTGDAESKGHVVGNKPEGVHGGHEDSEEGAQPQDNVKAEQAKDEGRESDKNDDETTGMSSNDAAAGRSSGTKSGKGDDKASDKNDHEKSDKSSGKGDNKSFGEMDDSQESQEKKLTEKPPAKRVDPTKK